MKIHDWPEKPEGMKYTPLTEKQQDAIGRMVEDQELFVEVEEGGGGVHLGYHPNPEITYGDKRIQVKFPMEFTKPEIAIPMPYLDLKLKTRDGKTVAHTTETTTMNGQALQVQDGVQIDLIWDLMIDEVDEDFQSQFVPDLKGERVASESDFEEDE